MKKFSKVLVFVFAFINFAISESKAQTAYAKCDETTSTEEILKERDWWKTAIIDGAGALGGAASAAQFINVGTLTPWGWAGLAGGALLGGAAASLARTVNILPKDNGIKNITNTRNDLDWVGIKHNQLASDYFAKYGSYNTQNYFKFINENKSKYGVENVYVTEEYLTKQAQNIANIQTDDDILNYCVSSLPSEVDKIEFRSFLVELSKTEDWTSGMVKIKEYENTFISSDKLSKLSKAQMQSFFSTLRHSMNIW